MQELIEKFNKMPAMQKFLILGLVIALIWIVYFMAIHLPQQEEIRELEKKRDATDIELNEKKQIADNLPKYQEEVARLDEELQKQLQKLPNKAEIPKILRTISNLGKKAGLDFVLFRPGSDIRKDFYAEVPLDIEVLGNYHQVALFFDKVSQLSRIVNVTNIDLATPANKGGKTVVTTRARLVTYRFVEQSEQAAAAPGSAPAAPAAQ